MLRVRRSSAIDAGTRLRIKILLKCRHTGFAKKPHWRYPRRILLHGSCAITTVEGIKLRTFSAPVLMAPRPPRALATELESSLTTDDLAHRIFLYSLRLQMRGERHEIFVVSDFNVFNHIENSRGKSNLHCDLGTAAPNYHQMESTYFIKNPAPLTKVIE